ncbi:MAG: HEAT repeat domain-containing protein [Halobacteria archaeon]
MREKDYKNRENEREEGGITEKSYRLRKKALEVNGPNPPEPELIEELAELMDSENTKARKDSAHSLQWISIWHPSMLAPAIGPILRHLRDDDEEVVNESMDVVKRTTTEFPDEINEHSDLLFEAFTDRSSFIQEDAAAALVDIADEYPKDEVFDIEEMVDLLDDATNEIRAYIGLILRKLAKDRYREILPYTEEIAASLDTEEKSRKRLSATLHTVSQLDARGFEDALEDICDVLEDIINSEKPSEKESAKNLALSISNVVDQEPEIVDPYASQILDTYREIEVKTPARDPLEGTLDELLE